MAPEQGQRHWWSISVPDIWAFGAVLYEMLTGATKLFDTGDDVSDTLAAVLEKDPDSQSSMGTHVPAETSGSRQAAVLDCVLAARSEGTSP